MMTTNARHAIVTTPIGDVTLVATGPALTGIYFPHHWYQPAVRNFGPLVPASSETLFSAAADQLDEYFRGVRDSFELPVQTHGDDFQERVWSLVKEIPYGETVTYGELARKLGGVALAKDVGQAVGRNPLAIILPCHRVVGKDGKLTGYAGGLARKRALLELEAGGRDLRTGSEPPRHVRQTSLALATGGR
jgi:methylated-DNA-[protein]-cysteine S-methyltransferase